MVGSPSRGPWGAGRTGSRLADQGLLALSPDRMIAAQAAVEAMRTCPMCSARYEAPAQYCQVDGAPLLVETGSEDPYLGTLVLEQFRLVRVVGSGGMGVVYEGVDERLDRRVAVKILHRDLITNKDVVSRFHREALIAHQLDHPGIVRVILFGQLSDGNLYLVLEFLEGPTLAEALARDKVFVPFRAVNILGHISDAIGYAHARGIVHRDLKPDNIILTQREDDPEYPKVLDFGIAKMLIGAGTFVTQTGLIFGTAQYISPEGAAGEAVDQRGDVYSLGVIAYELLSGAPPFEADEPVQLLFKHMHEPAPLLRALPGATPLSSSVVAVVMRALAKNPAARQPDASAFGRALREALANPGPSPDLRSIVATASMPFFAADAQPAAVPAPVAFEPSGLMPPPVAAAPGSGVQQVRRVVRPASGPSRAVAQPVHTETPRPAGQPYLPPTIQSEALPPVVLSASLTPEPPSVAIPQPIAVPSAPPRHPFSAYNPPMDIGPDDGHISGLPRARLSSLDIDASDEIAVGGLPLPRRGSTLLTLAVILVSAILALSAAGGAAWMFRLLPGQRRSDEIAALAFRAGDALAAGRFVHRQDANDVEDLTAAVLALDPTNARAGQLRSTAATRLQAEADAERTAGRPERAEELLEDALRLVTDPALQGDLAAVQAQLEARRANGLPGTPRERPQPHVMVHHPGTVHGPSDGDSSLVHPPQPAMPVVPPPRSPGAQFPSRAPSVYRPFIGPPTGDPAPALVPPPQPPPPILPSQGTFTPAPGVTDPSEGVRGF